MGWVVDWIGLAQDRDRWRKVVSVLMTFRVPWNAGNFLTSFKNVSCTGKTLHHGVSKYINNMYIYQIFKSIIMLISEAAQSKAWECGRSIAEIVGSNPREGMVVCLL